MSTIYRAILVLLATVVLLAGRSAIAQETLIGSDPGDVGPYAVGHTAYSFVDTNNGNRPEYVSVWYPVDPHTIRPSTPPAQYPFDPYTGSTNVPISLSSDWQPLGYDPAYEGPIPSNDGPFPLVVVSPSYGGDALFYIFIGTRLASHGYVVAALEPYADCQWSWSPCDDLLTVMVNRPRDVSFVITQLLNKSEAPSELLSGVIDPDRIAVSGHSIGGYATYALAGGDDLVCDALFPVLYGIETLPYPPNTCVPTPPDPRIKAMISLDGSSFLLRWRELTRISMPSLIMGETVENSYQVGELQPYPAGPALEDWIARPHAAIDRPDSYRVDVDGANHYSFTTYCDAIVVLYNLGFFSSSDLTALENSWPCTSTGLDPVTISAAEAHKAVTTYMTAFLNVHLRRPGRDTWQDQSILTTEYALRHELPVEFFTSEKCHAVLPNDFYFTYRPHQGLCDVALKDPTGWFAPSPPSVAAVKMPTQPSAVNGGKTQPHPGY